MGGATTLWPSVSPCMLGKSKRWDETWEWCESSMYHSFIRFFQNKTKAKKRRKCRVFISITKMKKYSTHGFSISRFWAQLEHGQKRIRGEWSDLNTLIWGKAGEPEVFYYIYARIFFFFFLFSRISMQQASQKWDWKMWPVSYENWHFSGSNFCHFLIFLAFLTKKKMKISRTA